MVNEPSVLEQDSIIVIQTRNENLERLVSGLIKEGNIQIKSVIYSAELINHGPDQNIAFIIGSDIEDPVRSAQEFYTGKEGVKIILLAKTEEKAAILRESIRFSPGVGTHVSCLNESNESVLENLSKILHDSVKAESYRAILEESNYELSSSVSNQKEEYSQQFVNKLMDIAPIGIAIVSGKGKVLGLNKKGTSILEESETQILGSQIYRFFGNSEGHELKAFLTKSFERTMAMKATETLDLERETKSASRQFLSLNAAPFNYFNGQEKILVLAINDITEKVMERKKREEIQHIYTQELEEKIQQRTIELVDTNKALNQNVEELENINKELEKYAHVSSHDLQEPLRKIMMFADRISEKEKNALSKEGLGYLDILQNSADRMRTLIEDLHLYTSLNTSEKTFERTDLHNLINEIIENYSGINYEKGAIIKTNVHCKVDIIIDQFRQLMQNLIGNALKFSKDGVPNISIKCEVIKRAELKSVKSLPDTEPDTEYYHLSVTDKGIGFEAEHSERIFELFQRLHSKEDYPGTGIGLAIVQKIVRIHKGFISATSELNKGTTFDIYLPDHQNSSICENPSKSAF